LIDNETVFSGAGILEGTPKDYFEFLIGLPLNKNSRLMIFLHTIVILNYRKMMCFWKVAEK
jgi:hypothetical protein